MKLIINVSNLSSTGVIQVGISFINECKKNNENEYHIFLSKTADSQINKSEFPSNFHFYDIPHHPFYGLKGFQMRKYMKKMESFIKPDCMFTIFGPSYWKPLCPHLIGFAFGNYVYPESPFFNIISFKEKLIRMIMKKMHKYYLRKDGEYYVCETEDVSDRLSKLFKIDRNKIYTITNTYSSFYDEFIDRDTKLLPLKQDNEFRFLSLCAFLPHKNLTILNEVIPLINMKYSHLNIKFILTINEDAYTKSFSDEAKKSIINIGRVDASLCPQLYSECDALFLPTLLECFSANYPESMIMKKPILTSNLTFATGVCGDAALYFDPMSAEDIVDKIISLINDKGLYNQLIEKGIKQLSQFDSAESRAKKYLDICKSIINK